MILTTEKAAEFFEGFRSDVCTTDEKQVLIFCSTEDCDALCAAKVLASIFHSDGIPNAIIPVSNRDQVRREFQQFVEDSEDLRTVFLIGLGAKMNVRQEFESKDTIRVVIFDSHRPIHYALNNSEDTNMIIMVDPNDETARPENIPPADEDDVSTSGADDDVDQVSPNARKRQRLLRQEEKAAYVWGGSHFGSPAAYVVWQMAQNLSKDTVNHLWWSILSVTEHYQQQHMTSEAYDRFYLEFETKVRNSGALDIEEQYLIEDEGTAVNKPLSGRIMPTDDFQFPLLRSWTVWDSIVYSPFVAARLRTFHERGKEYVQLLLVRMGLPLLDCQNAYRAMRPDMQTRFLSKLSEEAGSFKLTDTTFRSFLWQQGYNRLGRSASDTVYALSALMEAVVDQQEKKEEGFWNAWSALTHDQQLLQSGLDLAKKLMTAIVQDGGTGILRRKHNELGDSSGTASRKSVLLWNFSDLDFPQPMFVNKPLAVLRLAHFLQDYWYHLKSRRTDMLLIGPQDPDGNCLVVSVTGHKMTQDKGNSFGAAFARTAEKLQCSMQYQGFDNTVVKVAAKNAPLFAQYAITDYTEESFGMP